MVDLSLEARNLFAGPGLRGDATCCAFIGRCSDDVVQPDRKCRRHKIFELANQIRSIRPLFILL